MKFESLSTAEFTALYVRHQLYREKEAGGEKLVLKNKDLCFLNFNHADLREIDFVDCNLTGVDFTNSYINNCHFDHCFFRDNHFDKCIAWDTAFNNCEIMHPYFPDTYFKDASFSGCFFENPDFNFSLFKGTRFLNCGEVRGGTYFNASIEATSDSFATIFPTKLFVASSHCASLVDLSNASDTNEIEM